MNAILAAIRNRWSTAGLTSHVPIDRVTSGPAAEFPLLPCVTMLAPREEVIAETARGERVLKTLVQMTVYGDSLDQTLVVGQSVETAYDRATLSFAGFMTCRALRRGSLPEDRGVWSVTCEFEILWQQIPT
jgi:hypothetical protein